ncbi:MAG: deoxyribose-phosphate aldolase [Planctomycetaceae bacterium]|nr:deoxyribose-phosphate aldolase [Planctomycetaceae bacterium]
MKPVNEQTIKELGKRFERLIFKDITAKEMEDYLDKSIAYNVRSVLVRPYWLKLAQEKLKGTDIIIGTGGSFPYGNDLPTVKELAAKEAVAMGYNDFEMTINHKALNSGFPEIVEKEIKLLRKATEGIELKIILEVCMLTDDKIRQVCKICVDNGVNFVKSSTGQFQGPTLEQACIMVDAVKDTKTQPKVSGVKFPKPQNALMYMMAGIQVIGGQETFEMIEGIRFIRERGIIPGAI